MLRVLLIFVGAVLLGTTVECRKYIDISLNNTLPRISNSKLYSTTLFYDQWGPDAVFSLLKVHPDIQFLIVEAHTQHHNISISYDGSLLPSRSFTSTDVGLVFESTVDTKFYLSVPARGNFTVSLSIHGYLDKAPMPGGCNMEFDVVIAPYLEVTHNRDIVTVKAAPPSAYYQGPCSSLRPGVTVEFYRLDLFSNLDDSLTYFTHMDHMTTVQNILTYGTKVPEGYGYGLMSRVFPVYPDIISIYGVVVTDGNYSAAYVPAAFGCSTSSTCKYPSYVVALSYIGACVGLFLCFLGHFFFNIHVAAMGFISTCLVTLFVLPSVTSLSFENILIASAASGAIGGICWMCFSCSSPVSIMLLNAFCLGSLVAGIVYFSVPDTQIFLEPDINFWSGFVMVVLLCQLLLMFLWHYSVMLSCTTIGAFLAIIPADVFVGSHLRYILINLIRRASVDRFNKAIIQPPIHFKALIPLTLWIILIGIGLKIQTKLARNRAPFPPPNRGTCCGLSYIPTYCSNQIRRLRELRNARRNTDTEHSPLLRDAQQAYGAASSAPPQYYESHPQYITPAPGAPLF